MKEENFYVEEGRRLERRQFARVAFIFMVVFATAITVALLFHPSRLDLAISLDKTSTILNGIMTAFVAIIMSYLGVSTWEAVSTSKEETRRNFRAPPTPPGSDQGSSGPMVEVTTNVTSAATETKKKPEVFDQANLFPEN